jgi:SOS-response transcriptional repressor LexA
MTNLQNQAEIRRQRIIDYLQSKREGYRASYGEIARVVRASKSTIKADIATLVANGAMADYAYSEDLIISIDSEDQLDITEQDNNDELLISEESREQETKPRIARRFGLPARPRLPVLGSVRAGRPEEQEAVEFLADANETLIDVLEVRDADYVLRVQGDSMVQAGVQDGDFVIIHPQDEAPPNGTIILAQVYVGDEKGATSDEATTLKRFYLEVNQVRLQPANDQEKPWVYDNPTRVKVRGVVTKVIRVWTP